MIKAILRETGSLDFYDIIIISLLSLMTAFLIIAINLLIQRKYNHTLLSTKKRRDFLLHSYFIFSNFSITKRYLEQMRKRYEMLCPEDPKSQMRKTMGISYIIWGFSVILLLFLFGLFPSFYTGYLSILSIIIINHELLEFYISDLNMKLMDQFDKFLSDTRHSFYRHGMIDAAITDASEMSGRIMKVNSQKMLNVLETNDKESLIRIYNETVSNRFLRMFLSVAVYVAEYGDKVVRGISVLLANINTLKSDLYIEMMNIKETNHKFSGMIFTTLVPVYLLDGIKIWSMDITPGMAEFYNGTFGVAVRIFIYVITVIMYVMINELKERNCLGVKEHYLIKKIAYIKVINIALKNYEEKNKLTMDRTEELLYRVGVKLTAKQFLLKRLMYGGFLFIAYLLLSVSIHRDNRKELTTSQQFVSSEGQSIPDKYAASAAEIVIRYVNEYKNIQLDGQKLEDELKKESKIKNKTIDQAILEEITQRMIKYKKEYFHWYETLVAIAIAGLAYWSPYWMLLYRRKVLYLNMGNEVAQFQTTIMMVMYLNNTTVLKILELMESFAVTFKESLKICINDYSAGDLDALEKLKLRERYEPFRRLVDNLIIADKIGIMKAFDEVEEERKVSQEMRNQDYRIARDKKVIVGMVMSCIPAVITVALYWIIPFAWNALGDLSEYDAIMNNLK